MPQTRGTVCAWQEGTQGKAWRPSVSARWPFVPMVSAFSTVTLPGGWRAGRGVQPAELPQEFRGPAVFRLGGGGWAPDSPQVCFSRHRCVARSLCVPPPPPKWSLSEGRSDLGCAKGQSSLPGGPGLCRLCCLCGVSEHHSKGTSLSLPGLCARQPATETPPRSRDAKRLRAGAPASVHLQPPAVSAGAPARVLLEGCCREDARPSVLSHLRAAAAETPHPSSCRLPGPLEGLPPRTH